MLNNIVFDLWLDAWHYDAPPRECIQPKFEFLLAIPPTVILQNSRCSATRLHLWLFAALCDHVAMFYDSFAKNWHLLLVYRKKKTDHSIGILNNSHVCLTPVATKVLKSDWSCGWPIYNHRKLQPCWAGSIVVLTQGLPVIKSLT